jgi:FtsP/CotA-like multicopper oxidase with cupredoxin domain
MNRTQRLALLGVAAVIVVVAIVVLPSLGGDDDGGDQPRSAAETTPPADTSATTPAENGETQAATQPRPRPQAPLLRAGKETEIEVTKGDTVRFRVRHPTAEEVHVHGYDITRDLEPNKTATVSFEANIEGIFEIELEQSGRELAKLTVEPD